jgi:hypothetical protein
MALEHDTHGCESSGHGREAGLEPCKLEKVENSIFPVFGAVHECQVSAENCAAEKWVGGK